MKTSAKLLLLCLLSMFIATTAQSTSIDLNDFWADPTVTVAIDGSSATIEENSSLDLVLLSNDPGLGEPEVITAGAGLFLTFDYNFVEGIGSDDEFGAFILDSTGASAGLGYEFFTQDTSSGTVSFDLSGLTDEPFIGLQFQLLSLPGDSDLYSEVTISNVQQEVIPEPTTLLLVGGGLFGFLSFSIWRKRKQS